MDKFIIRCNKSIEIYMIEYIESICSIGLKYDINNDIKDKLIIDIQSSPEKSIVCFCNTEQLTVLKYFMVLIKVINNPKIKKINLLDYSITNIEYLKRQRFNKYQKMKLSLFYLPYCYNPTEIDFLKDLYLNTKKEYQIGIISVNSKYRLNICNELKKKGIKVNIINKFGIERDKEMAKCQVLLNIHFNNNYKIFEEIRCLRWWFAGVPIISEISLFMLILDVYPYIIWSNYNTLVSTICDYFKNPSKYQKFIQTPEIINKIAASREEIVKNSLENLHKTYN
jgi:hypothetical protein